MPSRASSWGNGLTKRKLIEVSLPLEAINKEAAREKTIRHGHPREREQAARTAADAASQTDPVAPTVVTTPGPTVSHSQSPALRVSVVARGRYEGRYEVDPSRPEAIAGDLRDVVEEVVRHIVAAQGAENISIVVEVSAENTDGLSEAIARTVRENSKVLGFDLSEFEDVEW